MTVKDYNNEIGEYVTPVSYTHLVRVSARVEIVCIAAGCIYK